MAELTICTPDQIPSTKNVEDFQDILEIVGSQGKYQRRYLYFMLCPMMVVLGLVYTHTLFMLFVPEHHCSVPEPHGTYRALTDGNNTSLPQ